MTVYHGPRRAHPPQRAAGEEGASRRMTGLEAPDYWIARLVVERGIGAIYAIAFLVALKQFTPLLGERGLLPVPDFVAYVPFRASPSLFHLRYSDRLLRLCAGTGLALA